MIKIIFGTLLIPWGIFSTITIINSFKEIKAYDLLIGVAASTFILVRQHCIPRCMAAKKIQKREPSLVLSLCYAKAICKFSYKT
jgi:hypothetical protein